MEKYEPLGVVGEGSYGVVLKCKQKDSGRTVAIKKFIDSEEDQNVRKIALREIRVLRKLRHENLVNLIEVFRRRKHLYLVFEFIDHTLLDEMENKSHGLEDEVCRKYIYQILRGVGFCHDNSIIHRDVKPENVLVSKNGIVKLCDFGFARNLCAPGEQYTDYVATRWYRAPELLVSDVAYGKEVDIWAVGCLFAEMRSGEPLFPGDSDIDQLFLIAQCLGRLAKRHLSIMAKNSAFQGFQFPKSRNSSTTSTESVKQKKQLRLDSTSKMESPKETPNSQSYLVKRNKNNVRKALHSTHAIFARMFPSWSDEAVEFVTLCLDPEPSGRPGCNALLRLPYFTHDNFPSRFMTELNEKLRLEGRNPIPAYSTRKKRSSNAQQSIGDNISFVNALPDPRNNGVNPNSSFDRHQQKPSDFQKTQILSDKSNSLNPKSKNFHTGSNIPITKTNYREELHPIGSSTNTQGKVTPGQNQTIVRDQTFTLDSMSWANHSTNRKFSFATDKRISPDVISLGGEKTGILQEFNTTSKYSDHYSVKSKNTPNSSSIGITEYFPRTSYSPYEENTTTGPSNFMSTLPTSKSTPNISHEITISKSNRGYQNPEIQFATKEKRFSLQNVIPSSSPSTWVGDTNLAPQIHRKFSYSFESHAQDQESRNKPGDNNSSRLISDFNNGNNKTTKSFHHLPITTLAFNLVPEPRGVLNNNNDAKGLTKPQTEGVYQGRLNTKTYSNNSISCGYPQIRRGSSPQKLKTFSTNSSTYFPQPHHNNNNSNATIVGGYPVLARNSVLQSNQNGNDLNSYVSRKPMAVLMSGSSMRKNSTGTTVGGGNKVIGTEHFLPQVNSNKMTSASHPVKEVVMHAEGN